MGLSFSPKCPHSALQQEHVRLIAWAIQFVHPPQGGALAMDSFLLQMEDLPSNGSSSNRLEQHWHKSKWVCSWPNNYCSTSPSNGSSSCRLVATTPPPQSLFFTCVCYCSSSSRNDLRLSQAKPIQEMQWPRFVKISYLLLETIMWNILIIPFAIRLFYTYYVSHSSQIIKNVRYGTRPRNAADIYPAHGHHGTPLSSGHNSPQTENLSPVVVFVHGGGWGYGDKMHYTTLGKVLQQQGYTVFIANYTLHPEGSVEHMVQDLAHLLLFVEKHAHTYGGDKVPPNNPPALFPSLICNLHVNLLSPPPFRQVCIW